MDQATGNSHEKLASVFLAFMTRTVLFTLLSNEFPGFGYSRVGVFYHQNYQIHSFLWGQAATWISERFIILTRHFDYYWRRLTVNHYWDAAVRFLRQDADGLSVLIRRSTFLVCPLHEFVLTCHSDVDRRLTVNHHWDVAVRFLRQDRPS